MMKTKKAAKAAQPELSQAARELLAKIAAGEVFLASKLFLEDGEVFTELRDAGHIALVTMAGAQRVCLTAAGSAAAGVKDEPFTFERFCDQVRRAVLSGDRQIVAHLVECRNSFTVDFLLDLIAAEESRAELNRERGKCRPLA